MSAYSVYVFNGKIRTSHALRSRTLLLHNNDTAVDTIVSTAVSVLKYMDKTRKPHHPARTGRPKGLNFLSEKVA